jgi:hypothetical protein
MPIGNQSMEWFARAFDAIDRFLAIEYTDDCCPWEERLNQSTQGAEDNRFIIDD